MEVRAGRSDHRVGRFPSGIYAEHLVLPVVLAGANPWGAAAGLRLGGADPEGAQAALMRLPRAGAPSCSASVRRWCSRPPSDGPPPTPGATVSPTSFSLFSGPRARMARLPAVVCRRPSRRVALVGGPRAARLPGAQWLGPSDPSTVGVPLHQPPPAHQTSPCPRRGPPNRPGAPIWAACAAGPACAAPVPQRRRALWACAMRVRGDPRRARESARMAGTARFIAPGANFGAPMSSADSRSQTSAGNSPGMEQQ